MTTDYLKHFDDLDLEEFLDFVFEARERIEFALDRASIDHLDNNHFKQLLEMECAARSEWRKRQIENPGHAVR